MLIRNRFDRRSWEERSEEFGLLWRDVEDLAQRTAGNFRICDGLDERSHKLFLSLPLVKNLVQPINDLLSSCKMSDVSSWTNGPFTLMVEWQYGRHPISLHVRFDCSTDSRVPARAVSIHLRCPIKLKSQTFLLLKRPREKGKLTLESCSTFLRPWLRRMSFLLPAATRALVDAQPSFQYYCRFDADEYNERFEVSALPVAIGLDFVKDADVIHRIRPLDNLACWGIGKVDYQYLSDEEVVLGIVEPPVSAIQLESLLHLMQATLDLLERKELLA
ncbi:MAG: hypothetical protein JSS83_07640 [Cyanobacteria bacterium SZAS LIN-3]|nr:hypothetical protein [Cyanobacteria bacterium SZAS LIN-3]